MSLCQQRGMRPHYTYSSVTSLLHLNFENYFPYKYAQLISGKVAEVIRRTERQVGVELLLKRLKPFNKWGWSRYTSWGKEKNPDLNFRAYTKINFQWIRGASGMHKTIKL